MLLMVVHKLTIQTDQCREYLKRDDQILVLRLQNEENRSRMTKAARDKDRALAHSAANEQPGVEADVDMDDQGVADEGSGTSSDPEANGSKVIVIHPGSQNLRIGLASDALPKTVPMIIARKSRENESEGKTIEPRPKRRKVDEESSEESQKHFDDDVCKEVSARFTRQLTRHFQVPQSLYQHVGRSQRTNAQERSPDRSQL